MCEDIKATGDDVITHQGWDDIKSLMSLLSSQEKVYMVQAYLLGTPTTESVIYISTLTHFIW